MPASNEQASKSPVRVPAARTAELTDDLVREYLKNHDDFLQRNPEMLGYLHISHASGSAVSLVEKQVAVLRDRNTELRHRLKAITVNAKHNDQLFEKTSALVLKLITADSMAALSKVFITSMKRDFDVDWATLILYGENPTDDGYRTMTRESLKAGIGALFKGSKPVCSALRAKELQFIFPDGGDRGSAALMPLKGDQPLGLIGIASVDANRYNSDTGTLFLSHIAHVIEKLLPRLLHGAS